MTLLEKYIIARWCYAIGEEYISDYEYKYIEDKVREEYPDNEYLSRSWSNDPCPTELLTKYKMQSLIRSISFSHESESIPSLNTWDAVKSEYLGLKKKTRVSFKIDGWNMQANYYNGKKESVNTRGRKGNFLNADVVLDILPDTIPIMGKVKIIGEVSIPNDKWQAYSKETGKKSQRAAVSTALSRGDTDVLSFLAFDVIAEEVEVQDDIYAELQRIGFQTPMFMWVEDYKQLVKVIDLMSRRAKAYKYLTDGLVVDNVDKQFAIRLGYWEERGLQSYVQSYVEKRGSYGNSMVVMVRPITDKGRVISRVSVTNLQYIIDNNLQIGAPIAFDVRSEANCVLNTERTKDLQMRYASNWGAYRQEVDEKEESAAMK